MAARYPFLDVSRRGLVTCEVKWFSDTRILKEAQEEKWISQDLWPISKWMHKDVNASKILLHRFNKLLQEILLIIIWFSIWTQQIGKTKYILITYSENAISTFVLTILYVDGNS